MRYVQHGRDKKLALQKKIDAKLKKTTKTESTEARREGWSEVFKAEQEQADRGWVGSKLNRAAGYQFVPSANKAEYSCTDMYPLPSAVPCEILPTRSWRLDFWTLAEFEVTQKFRHALTNT